MVEPCCLAGLTAGASRPSGSAGSRCVAGGRSPVPGGALGGDRAPSAVAESVVDRGREGGDAEGDETRQRALAGPGAGEDALACPVRCSPDRERARGALALSRRQRETRGAVLSSRGRVLRRDSEGPNGKPIGPQRVRVRWQEVSEGLGPPLAASLGSGKVPAVRGFLYAPPGTSPRSLAWAPAPAHPQAAPPRCGAQALGRRSRGPGL